MHMSETAVHTAEGLIYHVFPLGMQGASRSAFEPVVRGRNIRDFTAWIPRLKELGVNAVLFGPVLSAGSHGYDSIDLYSIDPRLGSNADFAALCAELHENDIAVIMDAVFNHTGREFFAFRDLLHRREDSAYRHWYVDVDFSLPGPDGDGFSYACWDGHSSLPKLNLRNPEVRNYLLGALDNWIHEFGIDGLRMDAADVIDPDFWPVLRRRADDQYAPHRPLPFNRGRFWIMGEMVFGNYADICRPGLLDSITNYELYKGLYSAHNDANYFELAWSLKRQFGPEGIYRGLKLYTFVDNHDVDRIASRLESSSHMYPAHILLFTVPGVPSLYYGSENGLQGQKAGGDWQLRPELKPDELMQRGRHPDLPRTIAALAGLRSRLPALADGDYTELRVEHRQLAFLRTLGDQRVLVMVNSDDQEAVVDIPAGILGAGRWQDHLGGGGFGEDGDGNIRFRIPSNWGLILTAG
jgi:cyclomaltodextrinase